MTDGSEANRMATSASPVATLTPIGVQATAYIGSPLCAEPGLLLP